MNNESLFTWFQMLISNGPVIMRLTSEISNSEIRKIMADDVLSPRKIRIPGNECYVTSPTVANIETVSVNTETNNCIPNAIK